MSWLDSDISKENIYNEARLDRHGKLLKSLFEKLDVLSEYLGVEIEYKEAGYKVTKRGKKK